MGYYHWGRAYLRIFTLHVIWVCNAAVISFANPGRRRKGAIGEVVLSVEDVPKHLTTFSLHSTDHAALT